MIPLATQTVTVQRPGTVNDHGNTVADWSTATEHTVGGCSVQPSVGSERLLNRDEITTVWTVYAPYTADIRDTDRIVHEGVVYDISGPVRRWATVIPHLEIDLKAVAG